MAHLAPRAAATMVGPAVERGHGGDVLCDSEGAELVEPPPAPTRPRQCTRKPKPAATTVLRVLGPSAGGVHRVMPR
jgi:hypothetical protein